METENKTDTENKKELLTLAYELHKKEHIKDINSLLEYARNTITNSMSIFQSNTAEAWTEAKKSKKDIRDFYIEAVAPDYAKLKGIKDTEAEEILKHEVGKLFKGLNGSPYAGGRNIFNYYLEDLRKTTTENDYKCNLFSATQNPNPVIFPVSTLSFIAGRPSAGKTTALVSVGMDAIRRGKKVLFITTEETPKQIITRFIKNQFCNNCLKTDDLEALKEDFKTKRINDDFRKAILEHYDNRTLFDTETRNFNKQVIQASKDVEKYLKEEQLQVFDLSATNCFQDLEDVLKEQEPYTIVLLDYIQNLPYGANTDTSGSETAFREDIRKSTQKINNIIKNNDLIGIAGAQMNREGADEENPQAFQLKNMGDSGSLERVAHIVVMLGRRNNKETNSKEFYYCVMKDREAETTGLHFKLISNYYGYSYTTPEIGSIDHQLTNVFKTKPQNKENKTETQNKQTTLEGRKIIRMGQANLINFD